MRSLLHIAIAVGSLGLAGTALAADLLVAPNPVTGPSFAAYGELGGGWMTSNFLDDGASVLTASVFGNLNLGSAFNIQAEFRHWQSDSRTSFDTADPNETAGFAHLYWRDPRQGAFGVFGGRSELGLFTTTGRMWTGGAEVRPISVL